MQISPINNNNQSFGHSFRISISTKDANDLISFVNPNENPKLYKQLNSKIINWLNEDYYTNLRSLYGLPRKVERIKPQNSKHKEMASQLRKIDSDYARFNVVRSVYRKGKLAIAATGPDVSIIENIKGIKELGIAKSDSKWTYGDTHSDYVKALSSAVKNNILNFVEHDNVILRSPRNKEIMLKVIFKQVGKPAKNQRYELDDFEFHENITKRTLAPVNPNFSNFKQSRGMLEEMKKTVQYHLNKILKKRVHFSDIEKILYPKIEEPVQNMTKSAPKPKTFVNKEPKQLLLDFKD